ncbi:MAG TPA: hypothetical protein VF089_02905 [Candidatus Binatia bacterium]
MATHQDEIDEMLKARGIQAASPDLAQRIILKAQITPQVQVFSLVRWIKQTFAELHLPNPAYVLAATLIMGFVLGLNVPSDTATESAEAIQALSFLDPDEGLL